ncbi:hypothetical protein CES86_2452 [Brucella lupini]|uniref:Uncharacterized protein n=1 Tax=Brucella lupini TaxID=255457 RepID=A0A256GRV7_9HYPH|nr:hypothetical protein CES86_2452 [Brucella lupini]
MEDKPAAPNIAIRYAFALDFGGLSVFVTCKHCCDIRHAVPSRKEET